MTYHISVRYFNHIPCTKWHNSSFLSTYHIWIHFPDLVHSRLFSCENECDFPPKFLTEDEEPSSSSVPPVFKRTEYRTVLFLRFVNSTESEFRVQWHLLAWPRTTCLFPVSSEKPQFPCSNHSSIETYYHWHWTWTKVRWAWSVPSAAGQLLTNTSATKNFKHCSMVTQCFCGSPWTYVTVQSFVKKFQRLSKSYRNYCATVNFFIGLVTFMERNFPFNYVGRQLRAENSLLVG